MDGEQILSLNEILPYFCRNHSLWEKVPEGKKPPRDSAAAFASSRSEYHSKISLFLRFRLSGKAIALQGEADGVEIENGRVTVDEYIFLPQQADFFGSVRETALFRGKLLALALANAKQYREISLRLVVFAEGRTEWQTEHFTKEELSAFFRPLCPCLLEIARWFEKRESCIRFPYDHLREGQRELIKSVYSAVKGSYRLYACAPTGVGKTLSVLYPAMKALEKGVVSQVFYLSPKNTLKKQAAETAILLQYEKKLRVLTLSAKMALCPHALEECDMARCEYADAFYAKLPGALARLLDAPEIDAKRLQTVAGEEKICPFELALQAIRFCDLIICDYNHVFAPGIALPVAGKDKLLLIDEAHNLPLRIRENYSESLSPRDLDPLFADESLIARLAAAECGELAAHFAAMRKEFQEKKVYFSFEAPQKLLSLCEKLAPKLGFALRDGFGFPEEATRQTLRTLYVKCRRFVFLGKNFNADFAFLPFAEGGGKIALLHPRGKIEERLFSWKSAVFFSATLLPEAYYFETLGGRDCDTFLSLPSPFPRGNLFVGICDLDVSYRQRYVTAPKLCSIIRSATLSKTGNYMVFLPSFEYLNLVALEYKKRFCDQKILVQEKFMTAAQRRAFLEEFSKPRAATLIAFCVMGGIFSEGIDLYGDALSGVVAVGTGFPPPSAEAEAESASYYEKGLDGKSFAYTLPGFNRVLQAAGRVIRSETDRGFLLLCDTRYCQEDLKELFPESWENAVLLERDRQIRLSLENFWQ